MDGQDGKLIPQYEVHCGGCSRPYLGIAQTSARAIDRLIESGWGKRKGFWLCQRCLDTSRNPGPGRSRQEGGVGDGN